MRAVLALLALAACSSADSSPEPGKQTPPKPLPSGTISGTVTVTISGPGRKHAPEESFARTSGLDCDVAITGKRAAQSAHTAKDSGRYDATVPAGTYSLSFAKCVPTCCSGAEATREVTVTAGKPATADWSCECAAK